MTTTRNFPLGAVLAITTGHLYTTIDQVYEILNFMTGDNLFTHQLPRAGEECRQPLLDQHPQLADVKPRSGLNTWEAVNAWLDELSQTYGRSLPVRPLNPLEHTRIAPLVELKQLVGDKPVIPVIVPLGDETS